MSSGRSPEQAIASLELANKIRIDRAKLRLRISAGETKASRVLDDMPDCMQGCAVFQFLQFLPGVGKGRGGSASRAFVLIRKANAPGHKRLDQLTKGQMERLARVLREYEDNKHPAERGLS